MKPRTIRLLLSALIVLLLLPGTGAAASEGGTPKLVLLITVDQLRGDFPLRFRDRFGPDGFRYLMERGAWYRNAHFRHAITETAPGHATLATGGGPATHGIVGNGWYDPERGREIYCVEDDRHHILGREPKTGRGVSPRNMLSTTIGDELVLATAGRSRVFAVSVKDRGAILPAGRLGKAYWYDTATGEFVTSSFYHDRVPAWMKAWNDAGPADRYKDETWSLCRDRSTYTFRDADDRPAEQGARHLGRVFPHPLKANDPAAYYSALRMTPMADDLTLEFALALMKAEKIGLGGATDLLSVSFSATDYIGHVFGPWSLEMEDNLLRLDRTIGRLLEAVDGTLGLENTLVVLASDHGIPPAPEYLAGLGFATGRHDPPAFQEAVREALRERFETEADLVAGFVNPYLSLDVEEIKKAGLDLAAVERAAADEILRTPGFALAVPHHVLARGEVPDLPLYRRVLRSFHPLRSGNVYLVPEQNWLLVQEPYHETLAAMHGSPWPYDTWVPVALAGPGIRRRSLHRAVGPEDIAPTLALLLGIQPPSGCEGKPLVEALP